MNTLLPYADARQKVIEVARALRRPMRRETIEIEHAFGRVLAREVRADRDYPPFNRSTRDGFAVRASDVAAPGARLECVGELRAGGSFDGTVGPGQCVEIMTGASVPAGADAVAMIEHTKRDGRTIMFDRAAQIGDHIVPRGSEARVGALLVAANARVGYAEMALAAQAGTTRLEVFATCRGKLVFGLPGNPVSTMVTFELFVLPAIDLLSGAAPRPLPVFRGKLATPVHEKGPMTHFLPARIEWEGREARITQLPWQGSGDIVALALANGFLVVGPERPDIAVGEWVDVLPRRGAV